MSNINVNTITPLAGTSGTVNVSGSLKVSGSVTANGNIILGDSTADSVSLGAEVSSSIVPDATATYNLGSNAKKWNKVHAVSGSFLHISGATNFTNNVTVTGSMTVSGSSTFTNFGNFRNRLTNDLKAFEVSTDPTVAGGFREGMATPHTGSAPHLHFMLSGSGHTGIGLLNPSHTLHVSTSDGGTNKVALYVDGKSYFGSTISSSLTPDTGGTYALGTMAKSWGSLHVHGLGHIHTASINVVSSSLTPDATSTYNIGSVTKRWLSGSFVHVSASDISASGYIYAKGNLDVDGSTILGNQTANDTHTITGKSIAISGPITASTAITHISGANGNILAFKSGSFNGPLSSTEVATNNITASVGGGASSANLSVTAQDITLTSHGSSKTIHIDADQSANNTLDMDAGILDIDVTQNMTLNTGTSIDMITAGSDGHIIISSSHTAGDAVHIDASKNAGSIVNIDAGILDIDAIGEADISGSAVNISGSTGIHMGSTSGGFDLDVANRATITAANQVDISGSNLYLTGSTDIQVQTTRPTGTITLNAARQSSGNAIYLKANGSSAAKLDMDAGILDIDAIGDADISGSAVNISGSTGIHISSTSGGLDIDAASTSITGAVTIATGIQSTAVARTATDDGSGNGTIAAGTSVVLVDADSDANHIIILPAPVVGNIITIIENGTTGYELRTSNPASIGINGGTGSGAESAIAGAITYIRCVCVSSTSWIATQFAADGTESKVEAAA